MDNDDPSVTEGLSPEMDLGNSTQPTADDLQAIDTALDEAGVGTPEPVETPEPVKPDPTKPDPTKPDPAKPDPAKPDPAKPDPAKPDPTKPAETPDPAKTAEPTPDEVEAQRVKDLEQLDLDTIKPPHGISPKNAVNFTKLREVAKHYKDQAAAIPALEKKIAELSVAPADLTPEVEKELGELRNFRKVFDIENDPDFQKEFNSKLGALDDEVIAILKKNGLPEEAEKQLRAIGVDKADLNWWEKTILPALPFVDRERVQKRLAERADIAEQKSAEIEKFSGKREEVLAERQNNLVKGFEEQQAEIDKHLEQMTANVPWARFQEVPEKTTKEEKKQIEAHNAEVTKMQEHFRAALYPATPKDRAEVAGAAVASIKLASALDFASARVKELTETKDKLQKELDAIKAAGRPPTSRVPGNRVAPSEAKNRAAMPDEDAIEAGLMEAEGES
jgi:hypothetical protein